MDLVVFENNKPWVIDEFRAGRFDDVELASDVAETKFFPWLILRFGGSIGEYHPKLLCDRHLWRDFLCSSNLL